MSLPEYQRAGGEHPTYLLRIPTTQVLTQWELLRNLVSATGYWPVIGWDRFKQPPWEEEPVQDIVEAGLRVDVERWFEQQWLEHGRNSVGMSATRKARVADRASSPFTFRLHLGRFTNTVPSLTPIALIPTVNSWEVPAYLTVTANDWDPSPEVHTAIMKYWNERWKAELVSVISGAIEMRVLQPPATFVDSFALAKEQFLYSPDLVTQDLGGDIYALTTMLLNGHVWYFWWD